MVISFRKDSAVTSRTGLSRQYVVLLCVFLALVIFTFPGTSQDLGEGFFDHGVASPISNHRGTVATVDGNGRNVVLVWLFDHRGGYALLMIDAETGKSEEFPIPFAPGRDTPYSTILSGKKRHRAFIPMCVRFPVMAF